MRFLLSVPFYGEVLRSLETCSRQSTVRASFQNTSSLHTGLCETPRNCAILYRNNYTDYIQSTNCHNEDLVINKMSTNCKLNLFEAIEEENRTKGPITQNLPIVWSPEYYN